MLDQTSLVNSLVTICCSYLSLVGSILVLLSYFIARSKSTPKAAYLILHLAASDFFWFLASATQSTFWMVGDGSVPTNICYICGPTVIFTRMASLLWTCAISFDVLMSVNKRKWSWKSQEKSWEWYKHRYYFIIFLFSFPGALLSMIKQHSSAANSNLGCDPGYEKLGLWYEVFFSEVFPIVLGFGCNLYVYFQIRKKMSQSAFPQSVRKRRKRIMYHYIIVCILCWIPTIIFYFVELMGFHVPALEIVGRTSLYLSGFLNFLVFGMQDPHLKRSFILVLHYLGLSLIIPRAAYYRGPLKTNDVEKVVMFEEATISRNADFSKDKKNIYRYHKLSKDDKKSLYADRPDLDPKSGMISNARLASMVTADSSSSRDCSLSAPLLDKGGGDRRAREGGGGDGISGCEEEGMSSNESSRHSIVVLGDLMTCDDVESPLHTGSTTISSSPSSRMEEGVSAHLAVMNGACESSSVETVGASTLFDPRHSSEMSITSDERNSLGLHLLNPPIGSFGGAVNITEGAFITSSQAAEPDRKSLPHNRQLSLSSDGGAEEWDYSSSDDESDEEDEALNAPV